MLKLNLQFFAEGGEGDTSTEDSTTNQQQETKTEEALTIDDVKKMIQSETDRVRTSYSKELKALQTERDELKKSQMSAQEKADFEKQQYETKLKEREAELNKKEVAFFAVNELANRKLPSEFQEFLYGTDLEGTKANIDKFEAKWNEAIKSAVESKFKEGGRDVKQSQSFQNGEVTKDQFDKMGYAERVKLANDNPELYSKLRG